MTPWGNEKLDTVNNSFKKKKILDMYKKNAKDDTIFGIYIPSVFKTV